MNAVIDARYSSSSQREETVEVQIRECTKFAEENGYTILRCYTKSTPIGVLSLVPLTGTIQSLFGDVQPSPAALSARRIDICSIPVREKSTP